MTQSVYSWVEAYLRPEAQRALKAQKLLWLHFSPSFDGAARTWLNESRANLLLQPYWELFEVLEIDSVLFPEIDQAAQTLLQTLAQSKGWPVNLIIEPHTLKPIIGFGAVQARGLEELLDHVRTAWKVDAKKLRSFANQSFFQASAQDPVRFAADVGQTLSSIEEAFAFFVTPAIQSLSPDTGAFGAQEEVLLQPGVYTSLLCAPVSEGPNVGEVALGSLARSTAHDVLSGGFFRVSHVDGESLSDGAPWVKSLADNSQLLEALVDAWKLTRSPFLRDTAVELVSCLLKDFNDATSSEGRLVSYIWAPFERLALDSKDLLDALPGPMRQPAQEFFDIRAFARVPRIARSLAELAKGNVHAPADLKNLLAESKAKLAAFRERRSSTVLWTQGPVDVCSEWRALDAIFYALRNLDTVSLSSHVFTRLQNLIDSRLINTPSGIKGQSEQGLRPRELIASCGARLSYALWSAKQPAPSKLFLSPIQLKEELLHLQFIDVTVDTGFLGTRYDLVDHLGPSALAEQLRILACARNEAGMSDIFESAAQFILEESLQNLSRVKRLGLSAGSLYGSALKFFDSPITDKATHSAQAWKPQNAPS